MRMINREIDRNLCGRVEISKLANILKDRLSKKNKILN